MSNEFWDRVRDRAYNKYLSRKEHSDYNDPMKDWLDAELEEKLEEKIKEEAYLYFLKYGDNPLENYNHAKRNVMDRIRFLAFYIHESEYDHKPLENWVEAEKIYVNEF